MVDDPVDGIVPVEPKLGLPPVAPPEFEPPTGVAALATTSVTVRCALTGPVIVTVYEPGVGGAAMKLPVAVGSPGEAAARHVPATDAGDDCGCENVIVSPTSQFGKLTLYDPPGLGEAGLTVAVEPPGTVDVVVPPAATVVVVVPPAMVVVVVVAAVVVVVVAAMVVVVVVVATVPGPNVKLFGPAPVVAVMRRGADQNFVVLITPAAASASVQENPIWYSPAGNVENPVNEKPTLT